MRAELADLPLEWRVGTSCTGAVAVLNPGKAGPQRAAARRHGRAADAGGDRAAVRLDVAGRMHACGHDTHTAMLAGAARVLAARAGELPGEVRFMFQPGEEGYHGARFMIDDGLLDPLPDAAFALHIMPNAPHGAIGSRDGTLLASADMLEIVVEGRGGHASMPHDTRDPVPVACEIVMAIQTMVTRRFDAAEAVVVTITQMDAGNAHNVIPDQATLKGTIRTLTPERRQEVWNAIRTARREYRPGARMRRRHERSRKDSRRPSTTRAPSRLPKRSRLSLPHGEFMRLPAPIMGAEDFSYVLEKVPGMMAFLGVAKCGADWRQCCAIHSSHMMVDERVLPRGAAFLAGCATRFLARGWD